MPACCAISVRGRPLLLEHDDGCTLDRRSGCLVAVAVERKRGWSGMAAAGGSGGRCGCVWWQSLHLLPCLCRTAFHFWQTEHLKLQRARCHARPGTAAQTASAGERAVTGAHSHVVACCRLSTDPGRAGDLRATLKRRRRLLLTTPQTDEMSAAPSRPQIRSPWAQPQPRTHRWWRSCCTRY